MSINPREIPEGAIRYNTDSNKMEVWIGDKWMIVATSSPNLDGGARGVYMGGDPGSGSGDAIDFITISTAGNAIDFGNSTEARRGGRGCGSRTRGIHMGGAASNRSDRIDFVTMASTGNATDFGNLQSARTVDCASNQTRGLGFGGSEAGSNTDKIDFITIASTGNGVDFGNCTSTNSSDGGGFASPTRGFQVSTSANPDFGQFVTISTLGNATEFTDGSFHDQSSTQGASNSTRGLAMGGYSPSYTASIDFIEMATLGNAVNFGDLTVAGGIGDGTASSTRAVAFGRYKSPGVNDGTIDYVEIATQGNAVDFGDMNETRRNGGASSTAHGGL